MRIPGQVTGLSDRDLILFYVLGHPHTHTFQAVM